MDSVRDKRVRRERNQKARKLYAIQCKALGVDPALNFMEWGERRLTEDLQVKYSVASKWKRRKALRKMGYRSKELRSLLAAL